MKKLLFKLLSNGKLRDFFLALYKPKQNPKYIKFIRFLSGIQLQEEQLRLICKTLKQKQGANFLVFGVGHDSIFWTLSNPNGRTAFLEDNQLWQSKIKIKYSELEVYHVQYDTIRSQWKELIDDPASLELNIPTKLRNIQWDVILVDAPAGGELPNVPGRMKSIYMASQLIKPKGHIFVHDCNREVERNYCDKYLTPANFIQKVGHSNLDLEHYQML